MREGLPETLLTGKSSFTAAVQAVQANLPDNNLVVDNSRHRIVCGGIEIKMQPRLFAFYAWHVQRRLELGDKAAIGWKDTLGINNNLMQQYFEIYLEILKGDELHPDYLEAMRAFESGFDKDSWAQLVHHTNLCIKKAVGVHLGKQFQLQSRRIDKQTRLSVYSLNYPVERIVVSTD